MTLRRDHRRFPGLTIGALIASLLSLCLVGAAQAVQGSVTVQLVYPTGQMLSGGTDVEVGVNGQSQPALAPPTLTKEFDLDLPISVTAFVPRFEMKATPVQPVPGSTVWVDINASGTPGTVAETASLDGQTRINVRFPALTVDAVGMQGQPLTDAYVRGNMRRGGGDTPWSAGSSFMVPFIAEDTFILTEASFGVVLFRGGLEVRPEPGYTIPVSVVASGDVVTATAGTKELTPGVTRVKVVFEVLDLKVDVVSSDRQDQALAGGYLKGFVRVGSKDSPSYFGSSLSIPFVARNTFILSEASLGGVLFSGGSGGLEVRPEPGYTIPVSVVVSGGVVMATAGAKEPTPGVTRVKVIFEVLSLKVDVVDEAGGSLTGGNLKGFVKVGISDGPSYFGPSLSIPFVAGSVFVLSEAGFGGVRFGGGSGGLEVRPEPGYTIPVRVVVSGGVATATAGAKEPAPGVIRVKVIFQASDLKVDVVNEAGGALTGGNLKGFVRVGTSDGPTHEGSSLSIPFVAGNAFILTEVGFGVVLFSGGLEVHPEPGYTIPVRVAVSVGGVTATAGTKELSPGVTRVKVILEVLDLKVDVVSSAHQDQVLTDGYLKGFVKVGGNPGPSYFGSSLSIPFVAGSTFVVSEAGFGRVLFSGQSGGLEVYPEPGYTVPVRVVVSVGGVTAAAGTKESTPGVTRVKVIFEVSDLKADVVSSAHQDQVLTDGYLKGFVKVGGNPGPSYFGSSLSIPFVAGNTFVLSEASFGGVLFSGQSGGLEVYPEPGYTVPVRVAVSGGGVTVTAGTKEFTPGVTRVKVIFEVSDLKADVVNEAGVPLAGGNLKGFVKVGGNPGPSYFGSSLSIPFVAGNTFVLSEASFGGVLFSGQSGGLEVRPEMDKTVWVNVASSGGVVTATADPVLTSSPDGKARVNVRFNRKPVATPQTVTVNEDTDVTIALGGTDADNNPLTAIISTLPANGALYQTLGGGTRGAQITAVGTVVTHADRKVIYVSSPNGNGDGHGNFGFKVNDGSVDSDEATVTVNVTAVNDAPNFTGGADKKVSNDAGAQTFANWATNLSAGPANESGQLLNFLVTNDNAVLFSAQPAIDPAGTLTFTPAGNACGSATVTVRLHDNGGTANGGVDTSAPQTFTITVQDNISPVVTAALTWVKVLDKDKKDKEEDGKEDGEDYTGNAYKVSVSATDTCDPNLTVTAFVPQPLTLGSAFEVKYEKGKKNAVEIHIEKKKTGVKLKGPNEQALRALLAQAITLSGFEVTDGQVVSLISKPLNKEDDKSSEAAYLFRFDENLKLTSASGPGIKLTAFAVDASGNKSPVVEVVPVKPKGKQGQALLAKVSGEEEAGAEAPLPEAFGLEQNYPNPFNPTTTIRYALPGGADVRLVVYNILGQQVKTLVNGAQGPGRYTVVWDGRDEVGRPAATGMYIYRLQAGTFVQTRKMLFAK